MGIQTLQKDWNKKLQICYFLPFSTVLVINRATKEFLMQFQFYYKVGIHIFLVIYNTHQYKIEPLGYDSTSTLRKQL